MWMATARPYSNKETIQVEATDSYCRYTTYSGFFTPTKNEYHAGLSNGEANACALIVENTGALRGYDCFTI